MRNLGIRLGRREVLKHVSLRAEFGRITAILGPNGAGKSSLLRAVAGILDGEGEILLGGVPARAIDPRERAKQVSFVPQQSLLRVAMPVRTVVALGRMPIAMALARLSSCGRSGDSRGAGRNRQPSAGRAPLHRTQFW